MKYTLALLFISSLLSCGPSDDKDQDNLGNLDEIESDNNVLTNPIKHTFKLGNAFTLSYNLSKEFTPISESELKQMTNSYTKANFAAYSFGEMGRLFLVSEQGGVILNDQLKKGIINENLEKLVSTYKSQGLPFSQSDSIVTIGEKDFSMKKFIIYTDKTKSSVLFKQLYLTRFFEFKIMSITVNYRGLIEKRMVDQVLNSMVINKN